jgi:hypothetical protein
MAFGAYEEYGITETRFIPVGITYEQANEWRRELIIACGKPILLKDYIQRYHENENAAIQELTSDLELSMPENMVIIPDAIDDDLIDFLCLIQLNDSSNQIWPIVIKNNKKLNLEKSISNKVTSLGSYEKQLLKDNLIVYKDLLLKYHLKDSAVSNKRNIQFQQVLILIIGIILFIPGIIFNGLIVLISSYIAKNKVYVKEFYAPILFALCTFLYLLWYFIFAILGAFMLGWIIIPVLIILMISGYFSILFVESIKELINRWRYNLLESNVKHQLKELRSKLKNLSV